MTPEHATQLRILRQLLQGLPAAVPCLRLAPDRTPLTQEQDPLGVWDVVHTFFGVPAPDVPLLAADRSPPATAGAVVATIDRYLAYASAQEGPHAF